MTRNVLRCKEMHGFYMAIRFDTVATQDLRLGLAGGWLGSSWFENVSMKY